MENKQLANSDLARRVHWIAPFAIETIAADTPIDAGYVAFKPLTDVEVYFDNVSGTTFVASAKEIFVLPVNSQASLATQTKCLMY